MKEFVREHPGKVRLIYRHLPIPSHRTSQIAAAIDEYAAEKGRFWDYTMAVMGTKKEVEDPDELFQIAASLNLNVDDIKKRLANDNDPIYKRLTDDENAANVMGISATPTFILLAPGLKPSAYGPSELKDMLNGPELQKWVGGSS
jgi:protein-disulfide isomerase